MAIFCPEKHLLRHYRRIIAFSTLNLCQYNPIGCNCLLLHFEIWHLSIHVKDLSSLLGTFLGFRWQLWRDVLVWLSEPHRHRLAISDEQWQWTHHFNIFCNSCCTIRSKSLFVSIQSPFQHVQIHALHVSDQVMASLFEKKGELFA